MGQFLQMKIAKEDSPCPLRNLVVMTFPPVELEKSWETLALMMI